MGKDSKHNKISNNHQPSDDILAIVSMDFLTIILLVMAFILDYFYHDIINSGIITLSVDSLLALISVAMAILVPSNDSRTIEKYYINENDYKALRKAPNAVYINLLVMAILLFVIDIFFYVFEFNLSLIVNVLISVAFIVAFIVPGVYQRLKGDKTLIDSVTNIFNDYRSSGNNLSDNNPMDPNIETYTKSLNSVIEGILLKNGFESTLSLLTAGLKRDKNIKLDEYTKTFLYLVKLQYKALADMKDGHFEYPLEANLIAACIDNTYYFLFKNNELKSNLKDANNLEGVSTIYVSELIDNLNFVINSDDSFTKNRESFNALIEKLLETRGYRESEMFYLSLIYSLLIFSSANKEDWFMVDINVFSNRNGLVLTRHNFFNYVIIIFSSFLIRHKKPDKQFSEDLKILLKNDYVDLSTRHLMREECKQFEDFIKYSKLVLSFKDKNRSINHFKKEEENIRLISGMLERSICLLPSIFILLNYRNDHEGVDTLLSQISGDNDLMSNLKPSTTDIKWLFDTFHECNIISSDYTFQEAERFLLFISNYKARIGKLKNIKADLKLDDFVANFDLYLMGLSWTTKENKTDSLMVKDDYSYDIHMTYFVDKKCPLIDDLANPTIDLNEILKQFFAKARNHYFATIRIDDYNEEILEKIYEIQPVYLNGPYFLKYCLDNSSRFGDYFLNLKQTNFSLPSGRYCELFYGYNAFCVSIEPNIGSFEVNYIYEKDAKTYLNGINQSDDEVSIQKFINSHVALSFTLNCQLFYNENRVLIFQLPPKKINSLPPKLIKNTKD